MLKRSHGANDAKVMEALRQNLDEGLCFDFIFYFFF